jgi:hypothetical protein
MVGVWRGCEMHGMTGCGERVVECLDGKKVPRLVSVETERGGLTEKANEQGSRMASMTKRRASARWEWEKQAGKKSLGKCF